MLREQHQFRSVVAMVRAMNTKHGRNLSEEKLASVILRTCAKEFVDHAAEPEGAFLGRILELAAVYYAEQVPEGIRRQLLGRTTNLEIRTQPDQGQGEPLDLGDGKGPIPGDMVEMMAPASEHVDAVLESPGCGLKCEPDCDGPPHRLIPPEVYFADKAPAPEPFQESDACGAHDGGDPSGEETCSCKSVAPSEPRPV